MAPGYYVRYRENLGGCLAGLHELLNTCYPRPPKDVFYRLAEHYRPGLPAWTAHTWFHTENVVKSRFSMPRFDDEDPFPPWVHMSGGPYRVTIEPL